MPAGDIKGYIYSVETMGTLDGPGIRFVLFTQGCPLQCKYCHNRDTWDMTHGKEISVGELLVEVAKYQEFYKNSGGGVTASGGEPTLQPEFITELFKGVRELGLNTALDTSGYVEIDKVQDLLKETDLVILDIKHMILEEHKTLTGVHGERIWNFARYLSDIAKPVWVRQVLIPGINDSKEQLGKLADFLLPMSNVQRLELLGFHKLGTHKWALAGCRDPMEEISAAKPEDVEAAKAFLRLKGLGNVK